MKKYVVDINNDIFAPADNLALDFVFENENNKTLSGSVKYLSQSKNNPYETTGVWFGAGNITINDDVSEIKVRKISQELAKAIDENSSEKVKELKQKYSNEPDFIKAKKIIEKNSAQVWNVFDNKEKNIPYQALKALGITNKPSLENLLGNSVRYFEKHNTDATARIIKSILKNKNMDYKMNDIHEYLLNIYKKEQVKYNEKTIKYLIEEQQYDNKKLSELGIDKKCINRVLKNISLKQKIEYHSREAKNFIKKYL